MSETQETPSTIKRFRVTVFAFACVLGSLAAWILLAEVLRPTLEFTIDTNSTMPVYGTRDAAMRAARIGVVRGDLWSDAALSYSNIIWNQGDNAPNAEMAPFERTRALMERAIAYAPHDSGLWLLLAANYFRFDWVNERAAASIRMSYYTGPNAVAVVPRRLFLAVQCRALLDNDFQELVRYDIRIAVTRKAELMPALLAAYTNAPLFGRQFMENALAALDPSMLESIRSEAGNR